MIITQATLDGLRTTFDMRFQEAYKAAPEQLSELWTEVPSSTKVSTYGWMAQQLQLREWIGPRVAQNLSEHAYTLANKKFEGTIELDRDDIEDDNLGMFQGVAIPQLAEAVKKHPFRKCFELLQMNSYAGPIAFDGKTLFAADHPTFAPVGFAQTYDNVHALALTADNLQTVRAAGAAYVGEDGQPLEVNYTHLFVATELEVTAKKILESTTYSQTSGATNAIDNPMKGLMKVVIVPRLSADPTRWYVADLSRPLKPLIHQVRRKPEFVSRDNINDPKVFDLDKFTYGVSLRDAFGVSLPFLIATSKP
jgi:phage major head subunit gpT-like protein